MIDLPVVEAHGAAALEHGDVHRPAVADAGLVLREVDGRVGVVPDPEAIRIGMAVEVTFDDVTGDITLPMFRPVSG